MYRRGQRAQLMMQDHPRGRNRRQLRRRKLIRRKNTLEKESEEERSSSSTKGYQKPEGPIF
jgi:hypothetical protein